MVWTFLVKYKPGWILVAELSSSKQKTDLTPKVQESSLATFYLINLIPHGHRRGSGFSLANRIQSRVIEIIKKTSAVTAE